MELYHVYNRGVEKRDLFLDDRDRLRFVHNLFEFNDTAPAPEFTKYREIRSPDIRPRTMLIDIHAWCIMRNHYHLLVSNKIDGGMSQFLRKLNVGYAMYFNERYDRSGTLFQGKTKKILIDSDAHFLHILHYIHFNPLDFSKGHETWRESRINDSSGAMVHLSQYRWSSYLDYCRKKNFPSVLTTSLFEDIFPDYQKTAKVYLQSIDRMDRSLALE